MLYLWRSYKHVLVQWGHHNSLWRYAFSVEVVVHCGCICILFALVRVTFFHCGRIDLLWTHASYAGVLCWSC